MAAPPARRAIEEARDELADDRVPEVERLLGALRDDDVDFRGDEFGNERRKSFILSVRPAVFDDDIATFLVAMLA